MKTTIHMPMKNSVTLWKKIKTEKSITKGFKFVYEDRIAEIKRQGTDIQLKSKHGEIILNKLELVEILKKLV